MIAKSCSNCMHNEDCAYSRSYKYPCKECNGLNFWSPKEGVDAEPITKTELMEYLKDNLKIEIRAYDNDTDNTCRVVVSLKLEDEEISRDFIKLGIKNI